MSPVSVATTKADFMVNGWMPTNWKMNGQPKGSSQAGIYPMTRCKKPHHEEWAIHDYDGVPNIWANIPTFRISSQVMRCIEEHGEAFFEWFNLDPHNKSHHDDLSEAFEEAYAGHWDSKEQFAEEFAESMGYIDPDSTNPLWRYIDFEWFWNADLRYSHHYSNGHVFRSDV
jgi:antirestriction protein